MVSSVPAAVLGSQVGVWWFKRSRLTFAAVAHLEPRTHVLWYGRGVDGLDGWLIIKV